MQTAKWQTRQARMFSDAQHAPLAGGLPPSPPIDYDRMFDLDSFANGQDRDDVIRRLRILGAKDGLMDALDPRITITNPLAANDDKTPHPTHPNRNPNNPNEDMTVGFTFLGQFIDHDITLDPAPLNAPATTGPNLRIPFLNLDNIYGRGPDLDRIFYDRESELDREAPIQFFVDDAAPRDLPRTSQQRAIIADPRNDENVIISQLHLAFLKFHNRVTAYLAEEKAAALALLHPTARPRALFKMTQQTVRWHYQHIVVHQYLAASLNDAIFAAVRDKTVPSLFTVTGRPWLPREFQVAAFRFGHSQIRPGYKVNSGFGAPIFDVRIDPDENDPNDLRGGRRGARRFVEWDTFFDFGTLEVAPADAAGTAAVTQPKVKPNKRIDPFISTPMFELPVGPGLIEPGDEQASLAGRNLERHLLHDLPSGQAIANFLGYSILSAPELTDLDFHDNTPLWYYILKEALEQEGGERLGQVGSRIVAEVIFGLLRGDPDSYFRTNPTWVPDLPRRNGSVTGAFTMVDLLTFAGVA
ncbi:MAG: peroxidase [Verrucomicrobia bacterium]|nr:peroxidase [Leptolyngbya sp. ES-bin-22]